MLRSRNVKRMSDLGVVLWVMFGWIWAALEKFGRCAWEVVWAMLGNFWEGKHLVNNQCVNNSLTTLLKRTNSILNMLSLMDQYVSMIPSISTPTLALNIDVVYLWSQQLQTPSPSGDKSVLTTEDMKLGKHPPAPQKNKFEVFTSVRGDGDVFGTCLGSCVGGCSAMLWKLSELSWAIVWKVLGRLLEVKQFI